MAEAVVAPYGSWRSPITADLIVAKSLALGQVSVDGEDVYWLEGRPSEGGRVTIVRREPSGRIADAIPREFYARTRVHEYGGGAYLVDGGTLYFANAADQRVYRQRPGEAPLALTPAAGLRYADFVMDRARGRLLCVREDHTTAGQEASNTLVALSVCGENAGQVLTAGNDFYATPRLSPDGARLAWLTWNHPNMPWDGCELWVAQVNADGTLSGATRVAGGQEESIFQPAWSPDGTLYFVSDRSGWWNLYRLIDGQVEAMHPMEAEFGRPQWVFGMSTYAFEPGGRLICSYAQAGRWYLAALEPRDKAWQSILTDYTIFDGLVAGPGRLYCLAGSPTQPNSVIGLELPTGSVQVLRRSSEAELDAGYLSEPHDIEYPTERGQSAHGLYYAPRNRDYRPLAGTKPPLLVMSHGGPTGSAEGSLRLPVQFWTSRGFAVLDVNYGGSSGYGRAYRERLNGRWGIVDVDDCVNGARYLAEQGLVDRARLAIRGGSAGGYTTLAALAFRDIFTAGASHYGVADLEALARDTHKFESRYLDRLVGPYPERRDLYVARSPIHFTDRLSVPMILFQGLEDPVVPPNQAEAMFAAVRAKGLPVAYLPFAGEQHGFRRAENIKRALEAELFFYGQVFGFRLAEPVELVEIVNLPGG